MSNQLSLLNLFMTLCLAIGGIAAYRQGFARTAGEVQERVIAALKHEIDALHERINALEQENTRLGYTITTICTALKQRGIHITIDGDIVSIYDCTGESRVYHTRMRCTVPLEQDVREQKAAGGGAQPRQSAPRKQGKKGSEGEMEGEQR